MTASIIDINLKYTYWTVLLRQCDQTRMLHWQLAIAYSPFTKPYTAKSRIRSVLNPYYYGVRDFKMHINYVTRKQAIFAICFSLQV